MANTQILLGIPMPGLTVKETLEWRRLLSKEDGDDTRFWELEAMINAAPKPTLVHFAQCGVCGTNYECPLSYARDSIECCGVNLPRATA